MKNIILLSIAGIVLLSWAMMISHAPLFEASQADSYDTAQAIPDAKRPWAIFGEMKRPREMDYYTFVAKDEMKLKLQLLVPKKTGLEAFRPSVILIGPGISGKSTLVDELPSVSGAMDIVPSENDYKKTMMDKFTFITYRKGPVQEIAIPETGRYYLVVVPNGGEVGDYVLRVGENEELSMLNVLRAFISWFRIQWSYRS